MENYANSLSKFFEYLASTKNQKQSMILGYDIFDLNDANRNIIADICFSSGGFFFLFFLPFFFSVLLGNNSYSIFRLFLRLLL